MCQWKFGGHTSTVGSSKTHCTQVCHSENVLYVVWEFPLHNYNVDFSQKRHVVLDFTNVKKEKKLNDERQTWWWKNYKNGENGHCPCTKKIILVKIWIQRQERHGLSLHYFKSIRQTAKLSLIVFADHINNTNNVTEYSLDLDGKMAPTRLQ